MQNENLRGARTAQRRAHAIVQHLALGADEAVLDAHEAAAKLKRSPNGGTAAAKKGAAGGAKKKVPFRERKLEPHDVDGLSRLLYPDHPELRAKVLELFKDPLFQPRYDMKMGEARELTLKRLERLASQELFTLREVLNDATILIVMQETTAFMDMSLAVKAGVQWGLFGGSVASLGTEKHFHMLDKCQTLEVRGCFALTELGHGSNARGIETEAIYVPETQEFVINSPTPTSQKYWIGNAACHGNWATVFANLILPGGRNEGFHAFLVPIRDKDGKPMPGVGIADCGYKMGLNGVDNGRLWFNGVRVPLDNLLNKYGDVSPDGQYSTHIPNKGKRFNTMLDALVGGRICVGSSALNVSKLGLTIAVRYACTRRQFGLPKQPEFLLMDYLSHQKRLLPLIATTYALRIGMNHTKDVLRDIQRGLVAGTLSEADEEVKKRELFLLAGGYKAVSTWHRSETLQICRECCGGQGFAAENRIGVFKSDAEIDLTYEGDNTILMQAVAKALLQEFYSSLTGKQRLTNMLGYLKGQLGILVRSKNPMMRRYAAEAHLLHFDFYNDAFVWREFKILRTVVLTLRSKVQGQGMNPFDAWNSILDMILALGKAYVDRITCEKFVETIRACKEPGTKAVLKQLCRLWALSAIEKNMGWYVANSYFAPIKARAMQAEINKLCSELRPHALALVESFALPDHVVCAPIAFDWVEKGSHGYENEKEERERLLSSLSSQVLGDLAHSEGKDEGEEYDVVYYEDVDVDGVEDDPEEEDKRAKQLAKEDALHDY